MIIADPGSEPEDEIFDDRFAGSPGHSHSGSRAPSTHQAQTASGRSQGISARASVARQADPPVRASVARRADPPAHATSVARQADPPARATSVARQPDHPARASATHQAVSVDENSEVAELREVSIVCSFVWSPA